MSEITPETATPQPYNRPRSAYTYRCPICKFELKKKQIPYSSGAGVTRIGTWGERGTPPEEAFLDELYEATSVAFVAASGSEPAKLTDSLNRFQDKLLKSEQPIRIATTSGTNDGDYTIAARGVSRGEIRLSTSDSLTDEAAATAGTVTISAIKYQQVLTSGCPSCGSLNTRKE